MALGAVVLQCVLQYVLTDDADDKSTVALVTALAVLPIIGNTGDRAWRTIVIPGARLAVLILSAVLLLGDLAWIAQTQEWDWAVLSWLVPLIAVYVSWRDSVLSDSLPPIKCPHCSNLMIHKDGETIPF